MSKKPGEEKHIKRSAYILSAITVLILFAGCSFLWEPSGQEAVDLVKSYYLFYQRGRAVDAEIIERKKFDRACKCFPVKFRIIAPDRDSFEKTFYFFKNEAGQIEVTDLSFGVGK